MKQLLLTSSKNLFALRGLRSFIVIMLLLGMVVGLQVVGMHHVFAASSQSTVCDAIGSGPDCSANGGGIAVSGILRFAINLFSAIIGLVAVIMIMVGGFRFITSSGDSSKVATARSTILYAIIGLAIVALAQTIAHFALSKASNAGTACANNPKISVAQGCPKSKTN